jgi:hypothetical protein
MESKPPLICQSILSSSRNWAPHPLTHKTVFVAPPPFGSKGGKTLACGGGGGGPNSDEGTYTLVFHVLYNI